MSQLPEADNHIVPVVPEKNIDSVMEVTTNKCVLQEEKVSLLKQGFKKAESYLFGEKDKNQSSKNQSEIATVCNNQETTYIDFFSATEASLCSQIVAEIQNNIQTIYVSMPAYAQDNILAQRIASYVAFQNSKSVVINALGLDAASIVTEFISQLKLDNSDNIYHEFAHLMTHYFNHGLVLNAVIYHAEALTKQDFGYLYELASLIYEKFPKLRHKPLIRFIFIGNSKTQEIIRKKAFKSFKSLTMPFMNVTECVNALYLYTPLEKRTELFYQTVGSDAFGLLVASGGYPYLVRQLLPMPNAPSVSDRQFPEAYLATIIDAKIDKKDHADLAMRRLLLKKKHSFKKSRYLVKIGIFITFMSLITLLFYMKMY